jgi:hypothetical protein
MALLHPCVCAAVHAVVFCPKESNNAISNIAVEVVDVAEDLHCKINPVIFDLDCRAVIAPANG